MHKVRDHIFGFLLVRSKSSEHSQHAYSNMGGYFWAIVYMEIVLGIELDMPAVCFDSKTSMLLSEALYVAAMPNISDAEKRSLHELAVQVRNSL